MPRFFFHVHNGFGDAIDEEGQEVGSLAEARAIAIDATRAILAAVLKRGRLDLRGRIDIADASGTVRATVPFSDAVELQVA